MGQRGKAVNGGSSVEEGRGKSLEAPHSKPKKSTGVNSKGSYSYYLHLSHLHAYELFDTSTIEADPQDPMLLIRWGRYSNGHFIEEGQARTNRLVDAGTDAKFGEHICIELNSQATGNPLKEHVSSQLEFRIEVWNVNFIGSHKHIGEGRLALQSVLKDVDSTATWEVKLLHSPMWPKTPFMMGKVHMRGFLSRDKAGNGTTITSKAIRSASHKEYLVEARLSGRLSGSTRLRQTSSINETTDGPQHVDVDVQDNDDNLSDAGTENDEGSMDSFLIASELARARKTTADEA